MPSSKLLLAATLMLAFLFVALFFVMNINPLAFGALEVQMCNFKKLFTCDFQHGECCSAFTDWCKTCQENNWENCESLSENGPDWVEGCLAYGQVWQFNPDFTPEDADTNPQKYCKTVCIQ